MTKKGEARTLLACARLRVRSSSISIAQTRARARVALARSRASPEVREPVSLSALGASAGRSVGYNNKIVQRALTTRSDARAFGDSGAKGQAGPHPRIDRILEVPPTLRTSGPLMTFGRCLEWIRCRQAASGAVRGVAGLLNRFRWWPLRGWCVDVVLKGARAPSSPSSSPAFFFSW